MMMHRTATSTTFWYCTFITILFIDHTYSELEKPDPRGVRINKCCEPFEILIDSRCTQVNETTTGECVICNNDIAFIFFKCFINCVCVPNAICVCVCVCIRVLFVSFDPNQNFKFLLFVRVLGRWSPVFTESNGVGNVQVPSFYFAVGLPKCGRMQMWPIYYYPTVGESFHYDNNRSDLIYIFSCHSNILYVFDSLYRVAINWLYCRMGG